MNVKKFAYHRPNFQRGGGSMWRGLLASGVLTLCTPAFAQVPPQVPQFSVDAGWPKTLPNRWILGQVSGIATDRQDRIWVVHRPGSLTPRERAAERTPPEAKCCVAAPPVLVFDASGNLLFSWGGPGTGYQWPESEHGIYVDANDFVWLAGNGKTDGQLLKFTMDGKFVLQIGKQGSGNDSNSSVRLGSPADVAVDVAAKEVYAADGYANRRVIVFDSESGAYKRHWGAYGKAPIVDRASKEVLSRFGRVGRQAGEFTALHNIAVDRQGNLYTSEVNTGQRIQKFRRLDPQRQ